MFVHLQVHSAYSLGESAIPAKKLSSLAKAAGMPAVALTDTGNLFGSLEFSTVCSDAGIQPIIGTQLRVGRRLPNNSEEAGWVVLLAKDSDGGANLIKAASRFTTSGILTLDELEPLSQGLIVIDGIQGSWTARQAAAGRVDEADGSASALARLFGDRYYLGLGRHGLADEKAAEPVLLHLARQHGLPVVAVNDCLFIKAEDHDAHDVLMCVGQKTTVNDTNRHPGRATDTASWRATPDHWFKPMDAMEQVFADLPEALDNSVSIARRCAWMAEKRKPILPTYSKLAGRTEIQALSDMTWVGLERRLADHVWTAEMDESAREVAARPYRERAAYELQVIENMGFPGYFLIVADFIQKAKDMGIPVGPGRGSGAGSVVAWATTITDLDPLRWGLLFERFLNPDRVSMPDFDVDFCQSRRGEVIAYVQREYGADRVGQIITFNNMLAKGALRNCGRALAVPFPAVERLCNLVPSVAKSLKEARAMEPSIGDLLEGDEQLRVLFETASKLEGLATHSSQHAAGVVIGDRSLDQLVPMLAPAGAMPVTQYNMKWVEQAGLVKYDFLGLETLTTLALALRFIGQNAPDLSKIPLDDPAAYEVLATGHTTGVFQLESGGMRNVLLKMRPNRFEDLIAVVALYRPGPMDQIPRYIACKHGQEEPEYMHPSVKPILEETFGIMVYQEQVMQIARVLAGYSLGAADLLRRAMGKKIAEEMEAQRKDFVSGCVKTNGLEEQEAEFIFDKIAKFAEYGFNKSHAAAYALIAYQTAWMKAHYPAEFLAALMTSKQSHTDELAKFREEARALDIEILPPDINRSREIFTVERLTDGRKAVRWSLAALKLIGEEHMRYLVERRDSEGPFRSLADFAIRGRIDAAGKRMLLNLIRAGALDCLDKNRAALAASLDRLLTYGRDQKKAEGKRQDDLFGGLEKSAPPVKLEAAEPWSDMRTAEEERLAIGFYLRRHPLTDKFHALAHLNAVPMGLINPMTMARARGGAVVMECETRFGKASGKKYAILTVSDPSGAFEVMVNGQLYELKKELMKAGEHLLLDLKVRNDSGQLRMSLNNVELLDVAIERMSKAVLEREPRNTSWAQLDAFLKTKMAIRGEGEEDEKVDENYSADPEADIEGPCDFDDEIPPWEMAPAPQP